MPVGCRMSARHVEVAFSSTDVSGSSLASHPAFRRTSVAKYNVAEQTRTKKTASGARVCRCAWASVFRFFRVPPSQSRWNGSQVSWLHFRPLRVRASAGFLHLMTSSKYNNSMHSNHVNCYFLVPPPPDHLAYTMLLRLIAVPVEVQHCMHLGFRKSG